MSAGEGEEVSWEEAVEKAIRLYRRDLDVLREYDRGRAGVCGPPPT